MPNISWKDIDNIKHRLQEIRISSMNQEETKNIDKSIVNLQDYLNNLVLENEDEK